MADDPGLVVAIIIEADREGADRLLTERGTDGPTVESPWELGTDDPALLSLVGPVVFTALTQPEQVYLEYLLRANGKPLHMMPPVEISEH